MCYPVVGGTHSNAMRACQELGAVGGKFDSLSDNPQWACPANYAPVVATAYGVWCGTEVKWEKEFSNYCVMRNHTGSVFAFS
ncbi:subtilisin inhibitor-like [Lentzea atacamensis]|uniref:Subtilisin inhibitor-like n=1 Tax=Lentzea atacamensis TaxID=531938 RepID=A0A316I811_9PSEU|nr:subtilisin inhibitor-like [Lentzea atacamensis]